VEADSLNAPPPSTYTTSTKQSGNAEFLQRDMTHSSQEYRLWALDTGGGAHKLEANCWYLITLRPTMRRRAKRVLLYIS
jgi:hypothetical protein